MTPPSQCPDPAVPGMVAPSRGPQQDGPSRVSPLPGSFALKSNPCSPSGAGVSAGNSLSTCNCSALKAMVAFCLFFLCFCSSPSHFKSSFETKTSCSLKWTIRPLQQLQPESFSSWQEDENCKTISLRQIMHSSSSFETKYDLQFNFP